ncbi:hypothetical protein EST38_g8473 [Candolleomyces aberdarensis]|uniref:Metacaspase n=1 Tax=Candolleomyces aberdarensis TaxID=2316362 RepID=A0A4Q2DEQ7_9AGAR|nr:hypothetical protein EST38_g8473 [Candolleomyces aberdarensis]
METANESVSSPIVEVAGEIIPVASAPPLPPPEEHQVEASSSATPPIPSRPGSKKRALLIGIQKPLQVEPVTNTEGLEALVALVSGTQHQDARSMKQALIELYGYQESDITVLLDRDDHGCTLPTAENILKGIDELVAGAAPGDTFFFHFSSVSTQIFNGKSANGKDNISFNSTSFPSVKAITTCDNMLILNDVLHEKLVKPLPIGSHLIAVFDVCHSASLLDLKHFRCNRVWVPWTNKRKRRVLSALPLPDPLTLQETAITLSIFAKKAAYCDPKPRSPSPKRRNVSPTVTPSNKFSIPQCKHPSTIEEEALWLPQTALALDGPQKIKRVLGGAIDPARLPRTSSAFFV